MHCWLVLAGIGNGEGKMHGRGEGVPRRGFGGVMELPSLTASMRALVITPRLP
jgi:hypothetical protein